jgi:hypothetical protein
VRERAEHRIRQRSVRATILALLVCAGIACMATSPVHAEEADHAPITDADVAAAIEAVKADPNLAGERQVRTLRWADDDEPREIPSWLQWLRDFFGWLAAGGRLVTWLVIAVLVGLLVVYVLRFVHNVDLQRERRPGNASAPTHVRDLDIRPESLPADIGAAAWSLWEQGEQRYALSLLYRGLLSRLVHVHAVPIRDSSTEGDCLALVQRHLPKERWGYIEQLIRVWQRAVYGSESPTPDQMRALCVEFADALRRPGATRIEGIA